MNFKGLRKFAEEYDANLLATDPRFKHSVQVVWDDGSMVLFHGAFILSVSKGWYIVFTEHHNYHIIHQDDVVFKSQYDRNQNHYAAYIPHSITQDCPVNGCVLELDHEGNHENYMESFGDDE
jgi:hypothetical protein